MSRLHAFALAIALAVGLAAPLAVSAKPVGQFDWIVVGPGDQTQPSIDGSIVVYADHSGADWDVRMLDLTSRASFPIAVGPGDQESPDVYRILVAYRTAAGIDIWNTQSGTLFRTAADPSRAGPPAISSAVCAWELGSPGARDIGFVAYPSTIDLREGVLARAGDQHSPATLGSWIGFVDDAEGGAVRLHDTLSGTELAFADGKTISLCLGGDPTAPRAALARIGPGGDPDIEILEFPGAFRTALRVPGVQRNPHLSGDWVAFEDLSTGRSQVVLWNYVTGLVYLPHPSDSDQVLNDVSTVPSTAVRVVFADDAHGDLDIALYTLPIPFPDDGTPLDWPPPAPPPVAARCDDPAATVLATLELTRAEGKPRAASVDFTASTASSVLVCMDADHVSSAWVTLDDEALARPSDFDPHVTHLEVRSAVDAGPGRLSGSIAGKPGSTLRVRVLLDPAAAQATAAAELDRPGCATAGGGLAPWTAFALLALWRRRAARA